MAVEIKANTLYQQVEGFDADPERKSEVIYLSSGRELIIEQNPTLKTVGRLQRHIIGISEDPNLSEDEKSLEFLFTIVTILGFLDGVRILKEESLFPTLKDQVSEILRLDDLPKIKDGLPAQFRT